MNKSRDARHGVGDVAITIFLVILLFAVVAAFIAGARFGNAIGKRVPWLAPNSATGSESSTAPAQKQLWTCSMHPQVLQGHPGTCPICHMELTPVKTSAASSSAGGGERKIKYWWDPMMSPPYISQEPGKSPMGMDLVPVYEDEVSGGSAVEIDPVVVQNMGVRVAKVVQGPVQRTIRVVGYLQEPEPNRRDINLRVSGWIDTLYANIEGMAIAKGDPLFDLYSPELQVAIEEMIAARRSREAMPQPVDRMAQRSADALLETARRKLELAGVDIPQIERLAAMDHAPRAVTFSSPMSGYLLEKMVYSGAAMQAGEKVLRLADRSSMWLDLRVFEQQLPFIQMGQMVTASVDSMPGETFTGEVIFYHPQLDPMTRTALVRVELPNPALGLRQGMFATAEIVARLADQALLVPREAIIDTGTRQIAFVSLGDVAGTGDRHFEPRTLKLGSSGSDGMVQVLAGLAPGETIVTSGQFLLDSESRLKEAIAKQLSGGLVHPPASAPSVDEAKPGAPPPPSEHAAHLWLPQLDAMVREYLKLASALGAKQASDDAMNASPLVEAARLLADNAQGELKPLADAVVQAATGLVDQPIDQQRKAFKKMSDAVIALSQRVPPSTALGDKLFIAYCPMAPGRWLQTVADIANPYYATTMKQCGEIAGTIPTQVEVVGGAEK